MLQKQKILIFPTLLAEKEHILATDQLFYRFLSWIFKLSVLIVSEVLIHMPLINSTLSAIPGLNPNWEIIYARQKYADG